MPLLPKCGRRNQPRGPNVLGDIGEIFSQALFSLGILPQVVFRRTQYVVTGPKPGEAGADAIEYAIGFGILLLFGQLQAPQVIGHQLVRVSLEDRIDVFVNRLVLVERDVHVGAAEMDPNVVGIDL